MVGAWRYVSHGAGNVAPGGHAGMVYVADVLMNFQIGMVLTKSMHARLVMEGRLVAWYYIRRGTFVLDVLASLPVWPEVAPAPSHGTAPQQLLQL